VGVSRGKASIALASVMIIRLAALCRAAIQAGSFKAPVSEALNHSSQSTSFRAKFQFEFLLCARADILTD
jgi:hypothetical protein